jgi:hypothetical protein
MMTKKTDLLTKNANQVTNKKQKEAKYTLGKNSFFTWEEVNKQAKAILSKGARTLKGRELSFILDLLEYHPNSEFKKQDGIQAIEVGVPEYGTCFCFVIVDNNNNRQDFSYTKCTPTGKRNRDKALKSINRAAMLKAYREAVAPQTSEFFKQQKDRKCACCGVRFNIQVDHSFPSFVALVNDFEASYKPTFYPKLERCDTVQTIRFKRRDRKSLIFLVAWQKFHAANAQFQLLCGTCNLKKQDGTRYKPCLMS